MKNIEDHTFDELLVHDGQIISDIQLNRCTFRAGIISRSHAPSHRPTICNARLNDCIAHNAYIDGAIIEDTHVHNIRHQHTPIFLRANVYRHVTLSGTIGAIEIRGGMGVSLLDHDDETQRQIKDEWDRVNLAYYESVDWAIDIRDARFSSFSVSGIPSRLIRRDLETTAVVSKDIASEMKWRKLAYNSSLYNLCISALLEEGYDDVVLVACRDSKYFKEQMEDLGTLRQAKIAV